MGKKVTLRSSVDLQTIAVFGEKDSNEIIGLQPNQYTISWGMYAQYDEDDIDIETLSVEQNVSYHRIKHLLNYYVNNCLWYDQFSCRTVEAHFTATDNVFLVTPEVNITYFTNCLFAKFNSICKPNITVSHIEVLDHDTGISYDYEDSSGQVPDFLPYQEEFMGPLSIYDLPWWERDDISTYDNYALTDEELDKIQKTLKEQKHILDADFETIEQEVRGQMSQAGIIKEGEVVEVDFKRKKKKWKPKLV